MKYKLTLALITNLLFLIFATESFGQTQKSKTRHPHRDKSRPQQPAQTGSAGDYNALVKKLRAGGATATPGEKVSQPFFSVPGRTLKVRGEQIQVFEYQAAKTAEGESSKVSANGSPIGTTMVNWIAPPHFYKSGRLIVLYIGENRDVIKALENALGRQFAGK
ncbi:MAG: hypothetical protein M3033_08330 [Acidobacteriota bacterium]|nr:hypothetical protein [Acidobacteriota bacterium]